MVDLKCKVETATFNSNLLDTEATKLEPGEMQTNSKFPTLIYFQILKNIIDQNTKDNFHNSKLTSAKYNRDGARLAIEQEKLWQQNTKSGKIT